MEAETEEEMRQQIEERKANTPRGRAKREALVAAMELKDYEFNAHGVDLGQFYESAAIVPDGSERPQPTRDPELYYQASTVPGSHLPHVWVGDATHKVSTLDLAPYTTFTLITGIAATGRAPRKVEDDSVRPGSADEVTSMTWTRAPDRQHGGAHPDPEGREGSPTSRSPRESAAASRRNRPVTDGGLVKAESRLQDRAAGRRAPIRQSPRPVRYPES